MYYQRRILLTQKLTGHDISCPYYLFLCLLLTTYCLLFFLLTPAFSAPMGWAATYGGAEKDSAHSIQQTEDGGYIVAGDTSSFGAEEDIWVLKLRPDGSVEWQKAYGGASSDGANSIQQTRDGGYIVAGVSMSFGAGKSDVWVLKLRADGSVEWQKAYGGSSSDGADSIQQTEDGGYIVAGMTRSYGAGENDVWVLKLRADGSVEWQKAYGGVGADWAHSIQQTSDEGYIVAGWTLPLRATRGDFLVLKLRLDGNLEWRKAYGGDNDDFAYSIQQTSDGGYIVAGFTAFFGEGDLWILKLKYDGTVEWQKAYGGQYGDGANAIQQTIDGGYIVAGCTRLFVAGGEEIPYLWILKLKANGTLEWQRTYGGVNRDVGNAIQQTRDGGYIAVGETESLGAGQKEFPDLWVLKLGTDGLIGPSCDFTVNTSISVKDSNNTVRASSVITSDSDASSQDTMASARDTNASANILCRSNMAKGLY